MGGVALYNEIDPFCCEWLSALSDAGHIAPGDVVEKSVAELTKADLAGYNQVHLFAGTGLWSHALKLAGVPDEDCVWTGSCPCQPFSSAGEQKGFGDERHLWPDFARLIDECLPPIIFGEQVASKLGREWLAHVRADLEGMGYAVGAADLCAASVGAPHIRQRLFWFAYSIGDQQSRQESRRRSAGRVGRVQQPAPWDRTWQAALAEFRVLDDGRARSAAATDAARNAIVPQVAAAFIRSAYEAIDNVTLQP